MKVKGLMSRIEGLSVEVAEVIYAPNVTVKLSKKVKPTAMALVEALQEVEFVVGVHHNVEMEENK